MYMYVYGAMHGAYVRWGNIHHWVKLASRDFDAEVFGSTFTAIQQFLGWVFELSFWAPQNTMLASSILALALVWLAKNSPYFDHGGWDGLGKGHVVLLGYYRHPLLYQHYYHHKTTHTLHGWTISCSEYSSQSNFCSILLFTHQWTNGSTPCQTIVS